MKSRAAFLLTLAIVSTADNTVAQTNDSHSINGLSDVDSFTVLIETVPSDLEDANVTSQKLRTIAELACRRNDLPLAREDSTNQLFPYLYVRVSGFESTSDQIVYAVELSFSRYTVTLIDAQQIVRHARKRVDSAATLNKPLIMSMYLSAELVGASQRSTTWQKETIGIAPIRNISAVIREVLNEHLDSFCNEFLAASR